RPVVIVGKPRCHKRGGHTCAGEGNRGHKTCRTSADDGGVELLQRPNLIIHSNRYRAGGGTSQSALICPFHDAALWSARRNAARPPVQRCEFPVNHIETNDRAGSTPDVDRFPSRALCCVWGSRSHRTGRRRGADGLTGGGEGALVGDV